MPNYFTATFKGLTPDEVSMLMVRNDCVFGSHSHVAEERNQYKLDYIAMAREAAAFDKILDQVEEEVQLLPNSDIKRRLIEIVNKRYD